MKCFNHPEVDAVALCKNCSKGLCHDCLTEVPDGIACRGKCEDQVTQISLLVNRGIKSVKKQGRFTLRSFLFSFLSGATFVVYGLLSLPNPALGIFMITVGAIFIASSIFLLANARMLNSRSAAEPGKGR